MKKGMLFLSMFLTVMLISFIGASSLSLSFFLDSISGDNLTILLVFVVSFSVLFFSLNKGFHGNKPIAAVISFALAFGITYWVNDRGFNIGGFMYDLGISTEFLSILVPILAIALIVFLAFMLKKNSLWVFGGFLLASAFFVYEKALVILLGLALILIRLMRQ